MLSLLDSYPCLKGCFKQYTVCRSNGRSRDACVSKITVWCGIDYVCLQLFFSLLVRLDFYITLRSVMPIDMFAKTDSTSVVHNHCFSYTHKRYADHHDIIATDSCRWLLSKADYKCIYVCISDTIDWLDIWWPSSFSLNPVLFISMLWTNIFSLFQEDYECVANCYQW